MDNLYKDKLGLAITLAGLVIVTIYIFQLKSPLRISSDSLVYLVLAEKWVAGAAMTLSGHETHYPPGYPIILGIFSRAGLVSTELPIILNILFATLGSTILIFTLRSSSPDSRSIWLLFPLMLLSFVVIKHLTLAVSDLAYLFSSAVVLYSISILRKSGITRFRWATFLVLALALSYLSMQVRTIGVALLGAVGFWAIYGNKGAGYQSIIDFLKRNGGLLSTTAIAVAILVTILAYSRSVIYLNKAFDVLQFHGVVGSIKNTYWHIVEVGEILINLPFSKVSLLAHEVHWIYFLAGSLFIYIWIKVLKYKLEKEEFYFTDSYFFCYFGIVLIWPYKDPRFWLPVVVFMLYYVWLWVTIESRARRSRRLYKPVAIATLLYSLSGVVALGYSTYISYSGSKFPDRYGDGYYRDTYTAFTSGKKDGLNVNEDVYKILKKYN